MILYKEERGTIMKTKNLKVGHQGPKTYIFLYNTSNWRFDSPPTFADMRTFEKTLMDGAKRCVAKLARFEIKGGIYYN